MYLALLIFGLLYAGAVYWLKWADPEGYQATYLTCGGVFVTLLGFAAATDIHTATTAFLCFAATGGPAVCGSIIWRTLRNRKLRHDATELLQAQNRRSERANGLQTKGRRIRTQATHWRGDSSKQAGTRAD